MAFYLHLVWIMQMDGQIAIAPEHAPGSSRRVKSADLVSTSFAPRSKGELDFATGMQSLLSEIEEQAADPSAPSISGRDVNQDTPVAKRPPYSESARLSEPVLVAEVSVCGFTGEPAVQRKFPPQVQQKPLTTPAAMKQSKFARIENPSDMLAHLKSARGMQPANQPKASYASPAAMVDSLTAPPMEAIAVTAPGPTPKNEATNDVARSFKSAIGNAAIRERAALEAPPVSLVTGSDELVNPQHAVSPQKGEPAAALHSEPAVNDAHAPISPSLAQVEQVAPSADAAPNLSGSVSERESKADVASGPNPLLRAGAAFIPSSNQNHSRRTDIAPAFHTSRSTMRGVGTAATNEGNPLHASMQGDIGNAISNSIPARDATLLDRHSIPPSPADNWSSAASGERDAFAVLDRPTAGPETIWIHAGAHRAEAGYLDSSLGWVTVRADGTPSGVHASVVPCSAEASSALSNHLSGLNAFMANHQGHSTTVTLASPSAEGSYLGPSQQDGSMNGHQNQHQQQGSNPSAELTRNSNASSVSFDSENAANPTSVQPATVRNGRGVHLSVMA